MTNKKTNKTQARGSGEFEVLLGIAIIISAFIWPSVVISLVVGAIFISALGPASTRGSYWNSVGPVRGRNYENPNNCHTERYH
jgi:hypothetical protein